LVAFAEFTRGLLGALVVLLCDALPCGGELADDPVSSPSNEASRDESVGVALACPWGVAAFVVVSPRNQHFRAFARS